MELASFVGTLVLFSPGWFILLLITMEVFHTKGYSYLLGFFVGAFLPVIGLIVGLLMPKDQEAINERKARDAAKDTERQARDQAYGARLHAEYQHKQAARQQPRPHLEGQADRTAGEFTGRDKIGVACIGVTVLCAFLLIVVQDSTAGVALGIVALASFAGFVACNRGQVSVGEGRN